jgi:hypothetical protein
LTTKAPLPYLLSLHQLDAEECMRLVGALLALTLGVGLVSDAAAAVPRFGVFATINGKKLKAVSRGMADDPCVFGFYQATGGVVFTAIECRGRRRRIPRRNFQQVVFVCGVINPPATPPYEAACLSAVYSEARIRRGGVLSQKTWNSSATFELGPDGTLIQHSSLHLRIDSFDGTYVRGVFSGVFDMPLQAGTPTQAAISGEGQFYFPVRGIR